MSELTQERLKELLMYDPETGHFTRLVKTSYRSKIGEIAGSINNHGYIRIIIDYKSYQAHRLAFLYMTGEFPEKGLQVDHKNHKRDDNKWVNLRLATHTENQKNRTISKNNTSGCQGVYWNKIKEKWTAQIMVNGKNKNLGSFDNLEDAIAARKEAELKYNFHQNHGKQTIGEGT